MLLFEADSLNATDQQCDLYIYWKNNSVSTKFITTVSIKYTYFHFKHNKSFHRIKYIL
jgi:predicted acetyltransferase